MTVAGGFKPANNVNSRWIVLSIEKILRTKMSAVSNGFLGFVVEEFDREVIRIFCQQRDHPPLGVAMLV